MENRVNRFWMQLRLHAPRLARGACFFAVLALGLAGESFATGCDAKLGGQPALFQATLQIRGKEPVKQGIPVRAGAEVMVFAREMGVDITLEVVDSAGRVLGSADSPIRRTAVQRVLLKVAPGESYSVVLTGKDHADSRGGVEVRVVEVGGESSECLAAQRTLAKADAAYASGEAITRAVVNTQGVNAEKSYQDSANGYGQVSSALQAAGPSALLGQAQLTEASVLNLNLDNYVDARLWAQRAAKTFKSLGDDYDIARARATDSAAAADIAVSVKKSDTNTAARQAAEILAEGRAQLEEVVTFHAQRREFHDQAWAQNYIGVMYYYEGRYDEAIAAYKKSLSVYDRIHERVGQAQVLQNLALVEDEIGRASDAAPHFREALSLIREQDNPRLLAGALGNSALANLDSGNEDSALRNLGESLTLARATQDVFQQSVVLHHMGTAYARLGDQTRALDFERQALALFTSLRYVRGQTASLRTIANILRQQGHAEEALEMDRETLSLETTPWARPRISIQIAKDLIALGRPKEASDTLEEVINLNKDTDEVARARALQERAHLRASANDFAGAETDLKIALTAFKTNELPFDQFTDWTAQAQLMRQRGALGDAFQAVDQALALAEEVRLYSANPELRSTLLQPLRPAFDLKISMLFDQYQSADNKQQVQALLAMRALQTAEQARARALSDYQALDTGAPGLDPSLLGRRKTLYRELAARRSALEDSLDQKGTTDKRSQAIRSEIAVLRQELDQIDARIGAASANIQVRQPAARKTTSLQLSNIPSDVAVIEYWLGETRSFAWVATREGLTMTSLGPTDRIDAQAIALHTALRSFGSVPKAARLDAGEKLYSSVLEPISSHFVGKRTLIFALDGALHYVPFATLRLFRNGDKEFLIQNYDIAVTPSVQLFLEPTAPRTNTPSAKQMLLVDDPVYDPKDPRVAASPSASREATLASTAPRLTLVRGAQGGGYLPRLPGAAREAAAIAALLPPGSIDRLDGFAANRDRFLTSALAQYRLIHVASHATTDSEIPQASALILSTVDASGKAIDGSVLGADFMEVRLHADAVVLSACDTALGKSVAGEGLIGLQYAVLARGARSVVSSLWPAIDQMTAELMVKFYLALLQQHSSVISAWSTASRSALQGPYSDPGIWGAFMLTLSHVEDLNTP